MKLVFVAAVGVLFGTGIALSGMADPNKVLNFFDIFGMWDPSLAFVMGGGLMVSFLAYRFTLPRTEPFLGGSFPKDMPTKIDAPLIGGSLLFGVGWGIAGFCPGAAIPALGSASLYPLSFIVAVILGMWIVRLVKNLSRSVSAETAS